MKNLSDSGEMILTESCEFYTQDLEPRSLQSSKRSRQYSKSCVYVTLPFPLHLPFSLLFPGTKTETLTNGNSNVTSGKRKNYCKFSQDFCYLKLFTRISWIICV